MELDMKPPRFCVTVFSVKQFITDKPCFGQINTILDINLKIIKQKKQLAKRNTYSQGSENGNVNI
jgi:hypothetical protein